MCILEKRQPTHSTFYLKETSDVAIFMEKLAVSLETHKTSSLVTSYINMFYHVYLFRQTENLILFLPMKIQKKIPLKVGHVL